MKDLKLSNNVDEASKSRRLAWRTGFGQRSQEFALNVCQVFANKFTAN
jgi:hypothetical protein